VCTALCALLIAKPFVPRIFETPNYAAMTGKWKGGICLQSTRYTCVPACAATLIKMQGGNITEGELAEAMDTASGGTQYWYMKRGLRKFGYEATSGWCKSIKDVPIPCMLSVVVSGLGHVVVLLETNETGVVIGEPLRGKCKYRWAVFNKCYEPNGTYTVIKHIKP
jgi:ABC-type bacteriocin/lantibiotic exporter with double-glycine peptidase domain